MKKILECLSVVMLSSCLASSAMASQEKISPSEELQENREASTPEKAAQLVKDFALVTSMWDVEDAKHATDVARAAYERTFTQRTEAACKARGLTIQAATKSLVIDQALARLQSFLVDVGQIQDENVIFDCLNGYKEEASRSESMFAETWRLLDIDPQSGYNSLIEMGTIWKKYIAHVARVERSASFDLTNLRDLRCLDSVIRIICFNAIALELKKWPPVNISVTLCKQALQGEGGNSGEEYISSVVDAKRLGRLCASVQVEKLSLFVHEKIEDMSSAAWASLWSADSTVESLEIFGRPLKRGGCHRNGTGML